MSNNEAIERASNRTPTRGRPRIAREPVRSAATHARGDVVGRDGEVLTRKRTNASDPFYIDPNMVEKGWTLQWIAHTVVGNSEVVQDQLMGMLENSWRPVKAGRFPGRYMPSGTSPDTHIVRGGQGLYERPVQLTDEARAEEVQIARQQMIDRDQSLMGRKGKLADEMKNGFSMDQKYRGTGSQIRMSIDPALDAPAPSYQIDE